MRKKWIDLLKAMAIIAVLIDHTNGNLYNKQSVWYLSWFAVPLFSIIAGYNCFSSMIRHPGERLWNYMIRSLRKLLCAYAICAMIYEVSSKHYLDMIDYITKLVTFQLSGHFYYVFMHIQLVFAGYFIFRILMNLDKHYKESLLFILLLVFSVISMKYTNIMNLFGGGGKLFGGTYIVLFLLGGIIAKDNVIEKMTPQRVTPAIAIGVIVLTILPFLCWWRIMIVYCDVIEIEAEKLGLGCPGIEICGNIMGILAFMGFGILLNYIESNEMMTKLITGIAFIGKRSMPIFLYHILIIGYLNRLTISNIMIKRIIYFVTVIFVSVIIEELLELIKRFYSRIIADCPTEV